MNRHLTLCALCALCGALSAGTVAPLRWQVETSRPHAQEWTLYAGETVTLEPRFLSYGAPLDLTGATVVLHARTNAMPSGLSYQVTGTVGRAASATDRTNGWASVTLRPGTDTPGSGRLTYRIDVSSTNGSLLRAGGILVVTSTGLDGETTAAAVASHDHDGRYDRAGAAQAVSNTLAAAVQAEASSRAAGDVRAATNLQASLDAEILLRAAGDVRAATNLQAAVDALAAQIPEGSTDALRLVQADTNAWVEVVGGRSYLCTISNSAATVLVTATGGAGYNGPAVGTTWTSPTRGADHYFYMGSPGLYIYDGGGIRVVGWEEEWNGSMPLPSRLTAPFPPAAGWLDIVGLTITNREPLTTDADSEVLGTALIIAHAEDTDPHGDRAYADALSLAAPPWQGVTNLNEAIVVTNVYERPIYLVAEGDVELSFHALRPPRPLYLVVSGPDSVTFGADVHLVGGGSWQTNQLNHFLVWKYGATTFVNPVTASEE